MTSSIKHYSLKIRTNLKSVCANNSVFFFLLIIGIVVQCYMKSSVLELHLFLNKYATLKEKKKRKNYNISQSINQRGARKVENALGTET